MGNLARGPAQTRPVHRSKKTTGKRTAAGAPFIHADSTDGLKHNAKMNKRIEEALRFVEVRISGFEPSGVVAMRIVAAANQIDRSAARSARGEASWQNCSH